MVQFLRLKSINLLTFRMKKITTGLIIFIPVFFLFLSVSCEKTGILEDPGEPADINLEVFQIEVVQAANSFAFDFFRPLLSENKAEENIIVSPFSITSALSMTLNGAAGETFEAVRKTMRMEEKTLQEINETYLRLMTEMVPVDSRVVMEIANSVWVRNSFQVKASFLESLQSWYKAESKSLSGADPNSVDIVNAWIAEKTHDKITEMLDYLDPQFVMLLINAIYFNGKWRYQFDRSLTNEEPFYVVPETPKEVPMMHIKKNFRITGDELATVVEVPYGRGNYTMVVVLPDDEITTDKLAASLTTDLWNTWIASLENNTQEVEFSMPRFKYRYKRNLNQDLISMGMEIAFTPAADFSNITDANIFISRVLHEAVIETNEEGTEAAAATIVEFKETSMPENYVVKLNRPFLWFIREISTGTILFMGRIGDPSVSN